MTRDDIATLVEHIAELPKAAQDEATTSLAAIGAKYRPVYQLTTEERAATKRSAEDVHRGNFATPQQVKNLFNRFRRA